MTDFKNQAQMRPSTIDESPISPIRLDRCRTNSLENHLEHRPNRADLVDKNILPESSAAPGLLAHQKEGTRAKGGKLTRRQLQRNMLENKLNDKISHRPDPATLVKGGLLREDPRLEDQAGHEGTEKA
ncbi:RPEL repeat protein [Drechmeria coniospora]|uniref:RPEL repeat protein n=1 Tax=Drechmeria coniospora TaxID=98403 RepID=A0A151GE63_DRECN|nr:RPEL repeat protein [Drechmeria coniospora]KYK55378.1 RPEL repeat protein [Drechmeria coniospora]